MFMSLKSITAQSITAIATCALVISLVAFLTSVVPKANAESQVKITHHQQHAKGDRLSTHMKGATCSSHSWPYYEQSCQFDLRRPANEMRAVRVIVLR